MRCCATQTASWTSVGCLMHVAWTSFRSWPDDLPSAFAGSGTSGTRNSASSSLGILPPAPPEREAGSPLPLALPGCTRRTRHVHPKLSQDAARPLLHPPTQTANTQNAIRCFTQVLFGFDRRVYDVRSPDGALISSGIRLRIENHAGFFQRAGLLVSASSPAGGESGASLRSGQELN